MVDLKIKLFRALHEELAPVNWAFNFNSPQPRPAARPFWAENLLKYIEIVEYEQYEYRTISMLKC